MKIEWAPVDVPLDRRLQTLVTGIFTLFFFSLPLTSFALVALFLFYGGLVIRTLVVIYAVYIVVEHKRNYSALDGNGFMWNRTNPLYNVYRNYFPVSLVKTADLPPNKNYIIASFPHGILGTGICINMGLEISHWMKLFPQVRPKVGTLDQHFVIPFLRDLLRWWGLVSVSKASLNYYLTKSNDPKDPTNRDGFTSNAVAILVGGAQEALDSHPGQYIITLKNRKGFVKMAIRTGSAIVPSISFGEVDIFDQVDNPPDSLLRRLQTLVKKITGISPLIPVGRGFFNYTFGFVPYRRPIVQVVGAPIEVVQSDQPDADYVDKVHAKVVAAVEQLFEQHKEKYTANAAKTKLVIN
ncbi:2-acylglycerol O-acyltransferase 2-A-like [Drosophila sulfurigaster albostrigata]|uniref:2-acylglycerol O-acyltransferase 2-A-like n=1 Tax=Drosophila sulfurigaster albostrigata TaxID=89887 RepID=UPI002D219961|nr:2-acylglycerol O-acyltransferase 2-A-like [Drosophila sulfurigaster albostrigata]XP_062133832.1 2-acylglycerol O-acyltransferase 2-A-like [Drosophila sulfurigaster albostrigata]